MIKAETLFNMLPALSLEEEQRFFNMCGMVKSEPKKKLKRKLPTDQETTEYLRSIVIKKINR
jgi:hypothetical protein